MAEKPFVLWFDEISLDDVGSVGGKNASLGELHRALSGRVSVPEGFAITADAYRQLIAKNALWPRMSAILGETDWSDDDAARLASSALRSMVAEAPLPEGLAQQIEQAYRRLQREYGRHVAVAVRSSATAEDLPGASFAGQHESYLNVRGTQAVIQAVRRCFASLFTQRAISYRIDKGFWHEDIALSVGVQRMVRADKAASGVIFTLDTESGFRDVAMVTGVWGLGEAIVQGIADPDEFLVHKPTLARGFDAVLRHRIGSKQVKLVYASGGLQTQWRSVRHADRVRACLTDAEIVDLARQAVAIEKHYSQRYGRPTPMDVEWAKDGPDGDLYIIQARPETVHAAGGTVLEQFRLIGRGKVIATGQAVGERIADGTVRNVANKDDLAKVQAGDVLVAATTAPDWEPAMKRAAAIVTEHGGRTCHAAIVARELGIPAVVGVAQARDLLKDGREITVSCAEGVTGYVYDGRVPFVTDRIDAGEIAETGVEVMVNIGNPDIAFRTAALPVTGVGLARIEFIVAEAIRAHPMALLFPDRVKSARVRRELGALAKGYRDGADYFVSQLAEGVAVIAAAFYPRPVIVRTSDFKTNEYASLLGGADFETTESNPMIGFRGASRYAHPAYRPAFELECRALKRVRDEMGLTNLIVMIPFCRRIGEAEKVLAVMTEHGLKRGANGLQIYVMCEIPSNVVLVDDFAKLFDGFSIGSNDLTQLTLGVDRDSDILAFDFDEQDPAVLRLIEQVIEGAHRNHRHCGICGQGPSDRPEFASWLIEHGIDSISLNPDSAPSVMQRLAESRRERKPSGRQAARQPEAAQA